VKQAHETESFWAVLTGKSSLLKWAHQLNQQAPVEMFRFTSINGRFEAVPVISPRRNTLLLEPFPVIQEDLYNASQPSKHIHIHVIASECFPCKAEQTY